MFLDLQSYEPRGPQVPLCRRCQRPVGFGEPAEKLVFQDIPDHPLSELSGTYHEPCARPLVGLKRALDLPGRSAF